LLKLLTERQCENQHTNQKNNSAKAQLASMLKLIELISTNPFSIDERDTIILYDSQQFTSSGNKTIALIKRRESLPEEYRRIVCKRSNCSNNSSLNNGKTVQPYKTTLIFRMHAECKQLTACLWPSIHHNSMRQRW
jgi:hypothetical protein